MSHSKKGQHLPNVHKHTSRAFNRQSQHSDPSAAFTALCHPRVRLLLSAFIDSLVPLPCGLRKSSVGQLSSEPTGHLSLSCLQLHLFLLQFSYARWRVAQETLSCGTWLRWSAAIRGHCPTLFPKHLHALQQLHIGYRGSALGFLLPTEEEAYINFLSINQKCSL